MDLVLSCLVFVWVDFSLLESSKYELNRWTRVWIRAWVYDFDLELPQVISHLLWCMVTSTVQEKDCVVSPVGRFSIQLLHEMPHKQHHHVSICVDLWERKVESPIIGQSCEQSKTWLDSLGYHRSCSHRRSPDATRKVSLINPRLVYVDDDLLLLHEL